MRIWTIHPKYMDSKGLVALWREGLLAKAVLEGKTEGYKQHPQLKRFREHNAPLDAICEYLRCVFQEACHRGYHFNISKLPKKIKKVSPIAATRGQFNYEWKHLSKKLQLRDRKAFSILLNVKRRQVHPSFHLISGPIAYWEKL